MEGYLSTVVGSDYFFGDKSVVIHSSNTTRLTCANFVLVGNGSASATPTVTAMPSSYTGGAEKGFGGLSVLRLVGSVVVGLLL